MKTNWEGLVEAGDFYTTSIHFVSYRSLTVVLQASGPKLSSLTSWIIHVGWVRRFLRQCHCQTIAPIVTTRTAIELPLPFKKGTRHISLYWWANPHSRQPHWELERRKGGHCLTKTTCGAGKIVKTLSLAYIQGPSTQRSLKARVLNEALMKMLPTIRQSAITWLQVEDRSFWGHLFLFGMFHPTRQVFFLNNIYIYIADVCIFARAQNPFLF